jgi:hypothetical protein
MSSPQKAAPHHSAEELVELFARERETYETAIAALEDKVALLERSESDKLKILRRALEQERAFRRRLEEKAMDLLDMLRNPSLFNQVTIGALLDANEGKNLTRYKDADELFDRVLGDRVLGD